jgi:hypothetical protein
MAAGMNNAVQTATNQLGTQAGTTLQNAFSPTQGSKGGGQVAPTTTPTTSIANQTANTTPLITPSTTTTANPNVMQMASSGLQGAMGGTASALGYTPQTLAGTNLAPYQNPYTTDVINATAADTLRNAQIGLNQLAGQATAAKAFGGSRHGIAMSEMGRGVGQILGQQAAGLRQAGYQQAQQGALQDIANQMQGQQMRLGAANQLGSLANLGFGMGNTITDRLMAQGQQQQSLQQQLIDAAQARYGQYTGYPQQGIGLLSQALGQTPTPQSTTTSSKPGVFDYATLMALAKVGPFSDIRLKEDISKVGEWKGLNIYRWKWNDKAKELGLDNQVEIGVIAQELKKTHPQAVSKDKNGYYKVNYEVI